MIESVKVTFDDIKHITNTGTVTQGYHTLLRNNKLFLFFKMEDVLYIGE